MKLSQTDAIRIYEMALKMPAPDPEDWDDEPAMTAKMINKVINGTNLRNVRAAIRRWDPEYEWTTEDLDRHIARIRGAAAKFTATKLHKIKSPCEHCKGRGYTEL